MPTGVFESIASNIKNVLSKKNLTTSEINKIVEDYQLNNTTNLVEFINSNFENY